VFVYSRTITIQAPIQALYDFHLNTHNARLIIPPEQKIVRLEVPERIEVGAEIQMDVKVYGLRQRWRVVWEELQPPHGRPETAWVTDVARRGPFPQWRHRHFFAARPGGTELTDRVEYELPFGLAGRLVQPWVHQQFEAMFRYRQRKTKLILEEMVNPNRWSTDVADDVEKK
jgi:ligand-binding SRPBCC domain-containing protein